jgi:hypothetical protein
MKRPLESDYTSLTAYTRALEKYCDVLAQPEQEPVQVSPLEFVTMIMEKEHLIGKPLFWAEWPNKEKA